jgi:hypothetical protein
MAGGSGKTALYTITVCLCLSCAAAPSAQRVRLETEVSGSARYTVTFLAYYSGTVIDEKGAQSITGHASLSINREGVWGFYPDPLGKIVSRRGQVKYSAVYPREQEYAVFTVDEGVLAEIQALIKDWEQSPPFFAIPLNDCVSFVFRVCDVIGLKYNPLALFPVSAIRSIRNNNDQTQVYTKRR